MGPAEPEGQNTTVVSRGEQYTGERAYATALSVPHTPSKLHVIVNRFFAFVLLTLFS